MPHSRLGVVSEVAGTSWDPAIRSFRARDPRLSSDLAFYDYIAVGS